jgi:hypothetical protein
MWYAYAATDPITGVLCFLSILGNEKTLRASEMIFYFVFFSPFAFHFGVKKKTLPGSGKEQQQLRVLLFCLGLVFRKGRAKIWIMIEGKGKASEEEEEENTTAFLFPSCNNNRETRDRQRERDSERAKVLCKIDQLSFDNRERERDS